MNTTILLTNDITKILESLPLLHSKNKYIILQYPNKYVMVIGIVTYSEQLLQFVEEDNYTILGGGFLFIHTTDQDCEELIIYGESTRYGTADPKIIKQFYPEIKTLLDIETITLKID